MWRHLLPDDAEFPPEHETGEGDQEQAKGEEWDCDQTAEDGAWGYLAVAHRCDCYFKENKNRRSSVWKWLVNEPI